MYVCIMYHVHVCVQVHIHTFMYVCHVCMSCMYYTYYIHEASHVHVQYPTSHLQLCRRVFLVDQSSPINFALLSCRNLSILGLAVFLVLFSRPLKPVTCLPSQVFLFDLDRS